LSTGLRERKKLKTRAAIQKEALRLFAEKGYEETTIEEIAAAVEISPSTFFNYFPSKEAVVFQDDLDPLIFAAFNAQPADVGPITALRNAMRTVFSGIPPDVRAMMQTRTALVLASPELRAATLNVVIGNGDAHAKNFSLLHEESGALRLAPLYDLMSTLVYGDDRLAMFIDDVRRTNHVTGDRIVNEAAAWGLSRLRAREIVSELLAAIPTAAERAADETPGVPHEIREIIAAQRERLLAATA